MLARLTVYHPDRPTQQYYLDSHTEYFVGRDQRCALHLEDRRLSRRHAVLQDTGSGWQLSDLGSKNGTFVAGCRIIRQILNDPQWIEFGGFICRFDVVPEERRDADRRQESQRWDTSIALSRELRPDVDLASLSRRALESIIEITDAERGFIMLRQESGTLLVDASVPTAHLCFQGSKSVVERVLATGEPVVSCNVGADASLAVQPSIISGAISALACVPLKIVDRTMGAIYVDSSEPGNSYSQLDVDIMQAFANHAALVIGASRVRDDIVDLSALLPTELSREGDPDAALVEKLHSRLPAQSTTGTVNIHTGGIEIS